jgi:hypothetical protein
MILTNQVRNAHQIVLLLERLSSQIVEITVKIKKFQISTK